MMDSPYLRHIHVKICHVTNNLYPREALTAGALILYVSTKSITAANGMSRTNVSSRHCFTPESLQIFPLPSVSVTALDTTVFLHNLNTLRTGSFKLFKRPLPRFLTLLTL